MTGTGNGWEFADTMANLVRLAMLDKLGTPSEEAILETTRARAKAHIAANLQDPGLSIDSIAEAVGCTKRNLHKLFTKEDETLNSYIWNSRLERVRQDLSNSAMRHRSITDIAFAWGFNSSAHFSRSFRDRYGVAPRAYRTMA
jgi:AraC-like DNA-binding protein